MALEMMVFVTSNESRSPCATPGLRGWGLAERCGGTGDVAQLKGAVCQPSAGQRRGEPSLPGPLCRGMFSHAHTLFQQDFTASAKPLSLG